MTDAGAIANFSAADNSALFIFKQKIVGKTADNGTKNVEIMIPLKFLRNFWKTLEMPLIKCEINLIYVPFVTLWTQDNAKLLQQIKSGFARTINWNKHQWKVSIQASKWYLDYLIDPSFQKENRLFVLLFENGTERTVHTKYYLPTVEIKNYNVMINGQKFWSASKNDLRTYDNIQKIAIG